MSTLTEIKVPDIGGFSNVPIIDLFVKPGDAIAVDDAICTLESDKATMEVPATAAGVVKEVAVKLGDKVSEGTLLIRLEATGTAETPRPDKKEAGSGLAAPQTAHTATASTPPREGTPPREVSPLSPVPPLGATIHASPAVRAYARELGADLAHITPSGPNGRILKEDVTAWIKGALTSGATGALSGGGGLDLLPWPKIDFSRFGEFDTVPLSHIQKISGQNLARNWVMIPAVTYFEDADITELEAFRLQTNKENEKGGGTKLTLLSFIIKACVRALREFPAFNSSLEGDKLIVKKYFHIGFAADTPNGLVVPVIKDAERKGIFEIAAQTSELARQAREGKLKPADMQGASFTISSVGGIGGTSFSPIINAPEVAILGVSKSALKPVWDGKVFQPRLIVPLSLTADHRVIDGALATRFNAYLARLLEDFRRVTL
ncbi:MAG: dihydrolipoyllysine-residue acetyltransferase [Azoarcus sp.]|jgi:pyruvate dehydrogenase E2 component (dihydrolipoamide acetyltransferase)|nr:dihydrolipoyllysine-residue acetyltransferase [Azoarcus sp.]